MSEGRRNTGPRSGATPGGRIQQAKLVLLGDQGVGKSSMAQRFVRGHFPEHSEATVGGLSDHQHVLSFYQTFPFSVVSN